MTTYTIKNPSVADFAVGGYFWKAGETKSLTSLQINDAIIKAVEVDGYLTSDGDLTPLGGLATLSHTMATTYTYNGGGAAIAAVAGAITVPAITADASAQNAIATLFSELAKASTAIAAMQSQIEALKLKVS